MTEAFGARLLVELRTERLSELISSISAALPFEQNPTVPRIPFLRELLDTSQSESPVLSAQERAPLLVDPTIPSSPSPPSSPPLVEAQPSSRSRPKYLKPPIIEIISATTNASRTQLINHILTSLLLPQPGQPKGIVIYFDCAYKLSVSDLRACLVQSSDQTDEIITEALSRLHVIRPDSSRKLLNQVRKVESYIQSLSLKNVVLSAVALADLSVFYWSERWSEEEARFQTGVPNMEKSYSRESLHTMILTELGRLQKIYQCVIIASGLGVANNGTANIRTGLAGPWVRAVDIKIVLGRAVDNRIECEVDGRRWVAACGGGDGTGKAKCEIHVSEKGLELGKLRHES